MACEPTRFSTVKAMAYFKILLETSPPINYIFLAYLMTEYHILKLHDLKHMKIIMTDHVGFEVFTAVFLKSIIFWDMTPCSP
jgi:hypothetical protein